MRRAALALTLALVGCHGPSLDQFPDRSRLEQGTKVVLVNEGKDWIIFEQGKSFETLKPTTKAVVVNDPPDSDGGHDIGRSVVVRITEGRHADRVGEVPRGNLRPAD